VSLAVAGGLALGKPIGILLFCALAIGAGIAKRPPQLTWGMLSGGACLGGIGFTMSIFLASLALPEALLDAGKIGTLTGSLISAVVGSLLLIRFSAQSVR
jgi:NhaA family Na+:H+ antiporter